jgi:hypothetical protein
LLSWFISFRVGSDEALPVVGASFGLRMFSGSFDGLRG